MKPNPLFLFGLTLVALGGLASAQTRPTPAATTLPRKGVTHPKRGAAPSRTGSMAALEIDTSAFRHSGHPADALMMRTKDLPPFAPSKKKN
jgi:hypothetical protein